MIAVAPALIERYVKPGKLRIVFRAVLNHGELSDRPSEAAACAGRRGQFWAMHAMLFERQRELSSPGTSTTCYRDSRGPCPSIRPPSGQCLVGRQTLAALKATDAEQRRRGITVQPVFEIGARRIFGVQPVEAMAQAIELELPD